MVTRGMICKPPGPGYEAAGYVGVGVYHGYDSDLLGQFLVDACRDQFAGDVDALIVAVVDAGYEWRTIIDSDLRLPPRTPGGPDAYDDEDDQAIPVRPGGATDWTYVLHPDRIDVWHFDERRESIPWHPKPDPAPAEPLDRVVDYGLPRVAKSGRSFDYAGYRVRLEAGGDDANVVRVVETIAAALVSAFTRAKLRAWDAP